VRYHHVASSLAKEVWVKSTGSSPICIKFARLAATGLFLLRTSLCQRTMMIFFTPAKQCPLPAFRVGAFTIGGHFHFYLLLSLAWPVEWSHATQAFLSIFQRTSPEWWSIQWNLTCYCHRSRLPFTMVQCHQILPQIRVFFHIPTGFGPFFFCDHNCLFKIGFPEAQGNLKGGFHCWFFICPLFRSYIIYLSSLHA